MGIPQIMRIWSKLALLGVALAEEAAADAASDKFIAPDVDNGEKFTHVNLIDNGVHHYSVQDPHTGQNYHMHNHVTNGHYHHHGTNNNHVHHHGHITDPHYHGGHKHNYDHGHGHGHTHYG